MKFNELRKTLNEWDVTYVNKIGNKMASRNLSLYSSAKNLATQLKMQGATQIEIHEADLSKAQIKKVHDKADDLPKNDFIKRYGKDGDSVRFATATNIIKKQLGVEDYEEGFKSDAQRKAAFASGYKEKGKKKDEELDDKDKETIKPIIKQLQKSVKAHGKQAKQLQKDIKDEVEVTEARMPSDNDIKKKHGNATPMKTYKQGFDAANKGKKITTNPHKSMFGFDRSAWNKGFTDADQGFNIKTFSQNDYDDKGVMKKEEVVTEAVSDGQVAQARRMTDKNDHFGARKYLASIIRDKEMMQMYDSLEKMHRMDLGGNDALTLRGKLDKKLEFRLTQKLKKDAKRLLDAL